MCPLAPPQINGAQEKRSSRRIFGNESNFAWIVDDFFQDPDSVRRAALDLRYISETHYPGVSAKPEWDCGPFVSVLSRLLGHPLDVGDVVVRFYMVTKRPDELEPWQCRPHFDDADLGGVVYLNPPDQCRGGTAFYRHRDSGLEGVPVSMDSRLASFMKRHDLRSIRALIEHVMSPPSVRSGYIADSTERWERICLVKMRYNRLIMYPSRLFHSGYVKEDYFGQNMATRRLTLNYFIRLADHE